MSFWLAASCHPAICPWQKHCPWKHERPLLTSYVHGGWTQFLAGMGKGRGEEKHWKEFSGRRLRFQCDRGTISCLQWKNRALIPSESQVTPYLWWRIRKQSPSSPMEWTLHFETRLVCWLVELSDSEETHLFSTTCNFKGKDMSAAGRRVKRGHSWNSRRKCRCLCLVLFFSISTDLRGGKLTHQPNGTFIFSFHEWPGLLPGALTNGSSFLCWWGHSV